MSKVEKKIARLEVQIKLSEAELLEALTKKKHSVTEASVPTLSKIATKDPLSYGTTRPNSNK